MPSTAIIGQLTKDPEVFDLDSGTKLVSFRIADTPRVWDREAGEYKDGTTLFINAAWSGNGAINFAKSVRKGHRVILVGDLVQRNWVDKETKEERSAVQLRVTEGGPSTLFGTTSFTSSKTDREPPAGLDEEPVAAKAKTAKTAPKATKTASAWDDEPDESDFI